MVYGMANSIAFLILNMAEYLDNLDKKGMYAVFGIIGLAQITLFLTFKLVFFDLIYDPTSWFYIENLWFLVYCINKKLTLIKLIYLFLIYI